MFSHKNHLLTDATPTNYNIPPCNEDEVFLVNLLNFVSNCTGYHANIVAFGTCRDHYILCRLNYTMSVVFIISRQDTSNLVLAPFEQLRNKYAPASNVFT